MTKQFAINPIIKPLLASLLRLEFTKYLGSNSFKYLRIEKDFDTIWEKYYLIYSNSYLSVHTKYEKAFIHFSSRASEANLNSYLVIVFYMLIDFAKYVNRNVDYSKVLREIEKLAFPGHQLEILKIELDQINQRYIIETNESANRFKITDEGIFTSGQQYDALKHIDSIFVKAKKSIVLIDSYIDENTIDIFCSKKKEVVVKILTKNKSINKRTNSYIKAFNSQFGGLEIRISEEFHDRFIIIDEHIFYTMGASVKDAGKKTFMFAKISENFIIQTVKQKFAEEWDRNLLINN